MPTLHIQLNLLGTQDENLRDKEMGYKKTEVCVLEQVFA